MKTHQHPYPAISLVLEQVSHRYDTGYALRNFGLAIGTGEIVCVCGPSGCGKSTLLRLIAGLEPLQTGCIRIHGRVVASGSDRRQVPPEARNVGLVFQDYALFPHLTVRQNVAFGLSDSDASNDQQADQALDNLDLKPLADRYPHTLSSGQQQRVALLRALAPRPDVMLLDEPFSGLDRHLRQQLGQETLAILRRLKITTVVVTHDPEEAMILADRIVVLKDGCRIQDGPPETIYQSPDDPFVVRLFGPVNEFASVVESGLAATPLGVFPAGDLQDATSVRVFIRSSDILVHPNARFGDGMTPAYVRSLRSLGPMVALRLELRSGSERQQILARAPEPLSGIEPDSHVSVTVREGRAFVFPD